MQYQSSMQRLQKWTTQRSSQTGDDGDFLMVKDANDTLSAQYKYGP